METCRRTSPPSCRHTRGRLQDLAEQIRPLVTSTTVTTAQPSAIVTPWAAVFRNSGQTLRDTATAGHLDRGIHHVLPHLVIFHWNRLGLTATTQAVLSRAAREALLPTADQT